MNASTLLIGIVIGFAAGAVIAWLLARQRAVSTQTADAEVLAQSRIEIATLTERAASRAAEASDLQTRLDAAVAETTRLRDELARAREGQASLTTELKEEREQTAEKLALLQEAREALTTQFKTLANDILEEKSKRFSEQNRGELDLLLKPLGEKLQAFEKKIEDTYIAEAKDRHSLADEVRKLQAANIQISQDTLNLTRALKGESKTRGNWGEVILERVLERSGLVKGREYVTQATMEGEDGKLRPDVVVNLPENKHIVIDSKVSLVAYDRYYSTEDEGERALALKEHVGALRRHVSDLFTKRYQSRTEVNAPDFVAMFVPIEPAFNLAAGHDESLYLDAFEKKVVILTPSTLLAMLTTVATLWQRESQTRNAIEIARQSGALYDQFVRFVESLREVGKKIGDAQRAYETAEKQLSSGRGNLVKRSEDIRKLGAKAEKRLPQEVVEDANASDELPVIQTGSISEV